MDNPTTSPPVQRRGVAPGRRMSDLTVSSLWRKIEELGRLAADTAEDGRAELEDLIRRATRAELLEAGPAEDLHPPAGPRPVSIYRVGPNDEALDPVTMKQVLEDGEAAPATPPRFELIDRGPGEYGIREAAKQAAPPVADLVAELRAQVEELDGRIDADSPQRAALLERFEGLSNEVAGLSVRLERLERTQPERNGEVAELARRVTELERIEGSR